MNTATRKDIVWINYVKALSIIGVYFVHSGLYYGLFTSSINTFIHPFYVNAFFFVSGYLFFRKQLSGNLLCQDIGEYINGGGNTLIISVLYRLAIPTLLFSIIEFFPSHILRGHGFGLSAFLYKTIGGCTYWFTAALVVAELLLFLLLLTRRKNVWFYFICSIVLFGLGQYLVKNGISLFASYPSLPWQYKHGLLAILFLAFGGLYWRYEAAINKLTNKYVLAVMLMAYVVVLLIAPNYFHVLISMLDVNIPGIVLSLLSIVILIEVCKLLPVSKLLNYIGKNTIGLYFMSGALPIVLSMVVHKIILSANYIGLAFVFVGSLAIGLVAVALMNRFAPWLFDLRVLRKKNN